MTVKQSTIDQFRPQRANRNKHKERGMGALEVSMRKLGYVAPMTAAADGEIIDGSARLETSAIVFDDDVLVVHHDGTKPVIMVRDDIPNADTPEARQIAIAANRIASINLDWDVEGLLADAQSGLDLSGLFSQNELDEMLAELTPEDVEQRRITRTGRLYNAGDGHDIEPFKLAYRIEAIWRACGGVALDLYSGEGQLAAWYKRRFQRVITNDKRFATGDVDYSLPVMDFISKHLLDYIDFDYIDFDDEGSPAKEIGLFFKTIAGKKSNSFVMATTDGNGLNLQCKGKFNPKDYFMEGETRKATTEDYSNFELMATNLVEKAAKAAGFLPQQLSSYWGRQGHVVFQTWLVSPNGAV